MSLRLTSQDVVVVGRWNRAILTPAGIALRLFKLPKGTPVPVEVPMDAIQPFRVLYEDRSITAAVDRDRLIVTCTKLGYTHLDAAMGVARNALEDLPQTPVSAAGFNFYIEAEGQTQGAIRLLESEADGELSDAKYAIAGRSFGRSLVFQEGRLNFGLVGEGETPLKITVNFDRRSENGDDLRKWLSTPVACVREAVEGLLRGLGIGQWEQDNG